MQRTRYPDLADPAWLSEHYVDRKMSTIEIATQLGCTPSLVQAWLRRHGIKARGRWSGKWQPKVCERCASSFTPSGPAAKFCSDACRLGTADCESCGKTFVKRLVASSKKSKAANDNKYCSYQCRWAAVRGRDEYGRYVNQYGYVVLEKKYSKRPPSRGINSGGYARLNLRKDGRVLEHRHVMEQQLGRALLPGENVHHKNGVRHDNRPENLELWVKSQPCGQRVEDVVAWAEEVLRRYAPDRLA